MSRLAALTAGTVVKKLLLDSDIRIAATGGRVVLGKSGQGRVGRFHRGEEAIACRTPVERLQPRQHVSEVRLVGERRYGRHVVPSRRMHHDINPAHRHQRPCRAPRSTSPTVAVASDADDETPNAAKQTSGTAASATVNVPCTVAVPCVRRELLAASRETTSADTIASGKNDTGLGRPIRRLRWL